MSRWHSKTCSGSCKASETSEFLRIPLRRIGGRVLRLKTGYNPNSSSVGSDIPTFLAIAASAGAATTIALHLLDVARERIFRQAARAENGDAEAEE